MVGAHAVVRENIPPYAIVTGNPAKVVGYRHSAEQIEKLLEISWWDWSHEQILEAMPLLIGPQSENIELFIDKYWMNNIQLLQVEAQ